MNNIQGEENVFSYLISLIPGRQDTFGDSNHLIDNAINIENFQREQTQSLHELSLQSIKEVSLQGSIKSTETDHNENELHLCAFEGCFKTFSSKWILDRHYNSHCSLKLFKCSVASCSKVYKSKENLKLHITNKHLKEKPYQCRFCISRFSHRNGKIINYYYIF